MDIASIDIATKSALAAEYSDQGILVLEQINLPIGFEPRVTDLVFVAADSKCEIYIDARITYTGSARLWHEIMRRVEFPGHARLVTRSVDFFNAYRTFAQLLKAEQNTSTTTPEQQVRQVWLQKLGLFGNPTLEQIKKAYRKLALIHHPDRLAGASDSVLKESQERMREIAEAHHALVRPDNYCGTDGSEASGSYTE